ncbi:MAG: M42 family metallopeptidase [Planctomycetes bacterium]|nr:M42 family metallopeptidase [Planctomycetota bacterium]
MNAASMKFLKAILAQPSPSGYEQPVGKIVRSYMKKYADKVETDVHGNTWGLLNETGRPRVMLAGHCDEIGLMVTYINDNGFIAFAAVGGVNVPLLQGSRINIHTRKGDIPGVIAVKPLHLMTQEERDKGKSKISDLWIDIGAKDKKDAEKVVEIGDVATIDTGFAELRNGLAAGRGFDDRIGSFVVAEVLRLLQGKKFPAAVFSVATVQEELGLRGARTSAFGLDPDVGIAVDVGFASDCPDVNKSMVGDIKLGGGPIVGRGPNINPVLGDLLEKAAKKARVKIQIQAEPRATGTDANAMQITREGKAAALVSIPNRYMHSPAEVISLKDAENAAKLIAQFIIDLKPTQKFIP